MKALKWGSEDMFRVYETIIDKSTDGLIIADANHIIKTANRRAEEILGYAPYELTNKTLDKIVPDSLHKKYLGLCNNFIKRTNQHKGIKTTIRFLKKDGTHIPATIRLSNFEHPRDGSIIIALFSDTVEIKKSQIALRKSEERFVKIFRANPTAMAIVRVSDNCIIDVNKSFLFLFGYSYDELAGKNADEINLSLFKKRKKNSEPEKKDGRNYELEIVRKSGEVMHALCSTENIELNGEEHIIATISDITENKIASEAKSKQNEHLEAIVHERTIELTKALEREKEINDLKWRFVTMASHEFRTPLTAMLSSLHLIEKYNGSDDAVKRKKHIERIEAAVNDITGILNDFLSLERLEHGKVEFSQDRIDIEQVITGIIAEMNRYLKSGQKIEYTHEGTTSALFDERMLKNIITNLVSNAIKYSGENSSVNISSSIKNNRVTISVKDQGIGIPEADQKHLFNLFFRAKNAEVIQGTGLGLTIIKKYVDLLKGEIQFTSAENRGSTFTIELPLRPEEEN